VQISERKEEFRQTLQKYSATKSNAEAQALKGGPNARAKLINANQTLDKSTALLEQSRMVVAQTEQIGNTVLTDLENQREILTDAHDKVEETRSFTNQAKYVLREMGIRGAFHKACVMVTIVILLGAIGAIVYFGFLNKGSK
jgi:vesicle transport through interaction with t-SNAREs protein 1